ncbi:adenine glycosylase [Cellulomonas bogoriensis 69B4 = DSM 16987]|uniref:Adenine DNA glycosylase n=1 Tax=Cellulomonas bogoriensis 69B4 = DSM 16987 TaxID=1386082 RepID=A0A0A0C088_9CELL|nr:A/G-specific adenine glycosylase [Cellulomonas bogoriensis]KGM13601.1 adenine glycosylase [Cellulomonas bogoriensis 69B4 = DSM 16987]
MPHPLVPPVLDWFGTHARDLPWREPRCTPWGVLVSEVMLQQTPVVRVRPAWEAWMARWPTPADLAAAPTADVLRAWDRLGYPRRALRLQQCARHLVDHHDGVMPTTEDALLALPGVGAYTAAAVMAFAHGRRSVVLDTNVRRVLARTLDGVALPHPTLTRPEHARAEAVVPADDATAARWSAAVMELGALVCTARSPRCDVCPVADLCRWVADGRPVDAHAHRRRRQGWAGTDRQARGRVMRALRTSDHPVPRSVMAADVTDPGQLGRVLDGLVADGLITPLVVDHAHGEDDPVYRLPS